MISQALCAAWDKARKHLEEKLCKFSRRHISPYKLAFAKCSKNRVKETLLMQREPTFYIFIFHLLHGNNRSDEDLIAAAASSSSSFWFKCLSVTPLKWNKYALSELWCSAQFISHNFVPKLRDKTVFTGQGDFTQGVHCICYFFLSSFFFFFSPFSSAGVIGSTLHTNQDLNNCLGNQLWTIKKWWRWHKLKSNSQAPASDERNKAAPNNDGRGS